MHIFLSLIQQLVFLHVVPTKVYNLSPKNILCYFLVKSDYQLLLLAQFFPYADGFLMLDSGLIYIQSQIVLIRAIIALAPYSIKVFFPCIPLKLYINCTGNTLVIVSSRRISSIMQNSISVICQKSATSKKTKLKQESRES